MLEVASLRKAFGAAQALRGVDLALDGGEVVALVGENGAGKSTLIKILAGVLAPDAGTIRIDGAAVDLRGARPSAMARGIAVIHQELMLCDNLSVAANLFLGSRSAALAPRSAGSTPGDATRRRGARSSGSASTASRAARWRRSGRRRASWSRSRARWLQEARLRGDGRAHARRSIGATPTRLLDLIEELRRARRSASSTCRIASRRWCASPIARWSCATARSPASFARGEIDPRALVRLMIGGAEPGASAPGAATPRRGGRGERARCCAFASSALERDSPAVSFELRAGEILGLFGLVGAGRTELLETLFGLRRAAGGSRSRSPPDAARRAATRAGSRRAQPATRSRPVSRWCPRIARRQGLVAEMSVARQPVAGRRRARGRRSHWRRRGDERRQAATLCESLDVRPPRPEVEVRRLSGGNQQKVVLGKWLAVAPRILLLDEPTRGVDVGARAEIHRHLRALAAQRCRDPARRAPRPRRSSRSPIA